MAKIKEQFLDAYSFLRAGMANERTGNYPGAVRLYRRGLEIEPLDPSFPYKSYVVPQSARDSVLLRMVRPERVFPHHDASDLAFATELREDGLPYAASHPNAGTPGFDPAQHRALTRAEKYLLILMADLGGQYYSLENADAYVAPPREEKP